MSFESWIGGLFGSGSSGAGLPSGITPLDPATSGGLGDLAAAWEAEPLSVSGNAGGFVDSGTWDIDRGSWWDRGGDKKVAEALKGLQGAGDKLGASSAQSQKDPSFLKVETKAYPSRGTAQLDALVQMLQKRREAYLTAAQGGQGAGQPVNMPVSMGLLGF